MSLTFGEIPGTSVGDVFPNRKALSAAGIHPPLQAGISGNRAEGANSIVVSGGYFDDQDDFDVLIYTGQGGNDPASRRQIADQEFTRGNAGLAKSCDEGLPVRVVRGSRGDPRWSPSAGFRYDGLFQVESYWHEVGRDGFRIYRFRLVSLENQQPGHATLPSGVAVPRTRTGIQQRVIRCTEVSKAVKDLHRNRCQVCQTEVLLPTGAYAEGAHVRPLGKPHQGPDVPENVLCLCPNCHVRFDRGAIYIDTTLEVIDALQGSRIASLTTSAHHSISQDHLEYHRRIIANIAVESAE